jgi:hypothetical protein
MFEVVWDTKPFNDLDWPEDGSSPLVWSFGDATGYANHADYVFGWKDDALQKILDVPCRFNCPENGFKTQSIANMNKCSQKPVVEEDIEGCKLQMVPWQFSLICLILLLASANKGSPILGLSVLPGGFQAQHGPASA